MNEDVSVVLRTSRVVLRELTEADLDVVANMMADEEQMSLYPRPRTREETKSWIDRNLQLYQQRGFGFWVMESPDTVDFLGYCGIRPIDIEGVEEIEMGWHVKKQLWGQGLATEAASACRDLAFDRFDIARLVATIDPTNSPSVKVAEKIRMRLERDAVLDGWSCRLYSIERP